MKNEIPTNKRNWQLDLIKDEPLKKYLEYVIGYQEEQVLYYDKKRKIARTYSSVHLIMAIVLFASSLILPIIPSLHFINDVVVANSDGFYAAGYLTLIISTIVILADRLFGHSRGWIRYSIAYLQFDSICSEFYGKWIEQLPKLLNGINHQESHLNATQLIQQYDSSLKGIVKVETENWRDIFSSQLEEFYKRADAKATEERQMISQIVKDKTLRASKPTKAHLRIEFIGIPPNYTIDTSIFLNTDEPNRKVAKSEDNTWVLMDVPLGTYRITYSVISDSKQIIKTCEDVLSVSSLNDVSKVQYNVEEQLQ